jgi:hypothetical protein
MNDNDLARAVARATGESVRTVKRLGFMLVPEPTDYEQPEALNAKVIDWDALQLTRQTGLPKRRMRRETVTC